MPGQGISLGARFLFFSSFFSFFSFSIFNAHNFDAPFLWSTTCLGTAVQIAELLGSSLATVSTSDVIAY